jgi:hypothetical protein
MLTNRAMASLLPLIPLLSGLPTLGAHPGPAPEVCVLTPRVEADRRGRPEATAALSRPTIFVREPLARARIVRGPAVLWERPAGLEGPLQGPIRWPLPPLRPSESLELQLQPVGAAPEAFATIQLRATSIMPLARNDALVAALGADPAAWRRAVEGALERRDGSLAAALLFAFEGPSAPDLDALRLEAFHHSCQDGGSAGAPSP